MDESNYEDYNRTTFTLTRQQTEFLKKIDHNQSAALRKALNTLIHKQKRDVVRENILTLSIGCIFLFFATLTPNIIIILISTCFGFFICLYAVGGMIIEIRRTKIIK